MDRDGKPAAAALVPSPAPHGPTEAERPRSCVACLGYHGSVNEGRLCLEAGLRAARELIEELRAASRKGSGP